MSRRTGIAAFLALAALFLILNRAAYKGYFTDDDFDNLSWTRTAPAAGFVSGLLSPRFQPNNFRPAGHLFYAIESRAFGFDFRKYVAAVHLLHLLNIWILWLLLRRLGAPPIPAAAACAFYALHMGFFEAVWKPAYIFDVLCTTFCLLSFLCYVRRAWILSFLCFWLAYKSKEPAVMLPFVLAAYELWLGEKRWKRLVPFAVVALSFGLQGLFLNPNQGTPYAFHFSFSALEETSVYYAGRMFLLPYLGFALAAAVLLPSPRIRLGLAAMTLLFVPVLFLPGRIENGYCYLPFIGLAIAFAGLFESTRPPIIAAFLLLWFVPNVRELRAQRSAQLTRDNDARAWVTAWNQYAVSPSPPDAIIITGEPAGFGSWGMEGAVKCSYPQPTLNITYSDHPTLPPAAPRAAFLIWNSALHNMQVSEHTPATLDASFIDTTIATPVWQLDEGFFGPENGFRWIAPTAAAHLTRPENAIRFELRAIITSTRLDKVGPTTVRITIGDHPLDPRQVKEPGWQTLEWPIPAGPSGPVQITIQTDPPFKPESDPRTLGIAVGSFGFR